MAANTPESAVLARYSEGAQQREEALCCPVSYDQTKLAVLPEEILERDYGCGDPSRWVSPGDTVLDLGSGAGKICWIASQIVGAEGRVIGIDMNREMLGLAAKHHAEIAERIGYDNVTFHRGRIQDLRLDLERLDRTLKETPVDGADAWLAARQAEEQLRLEHPLIADDSIDVVLSNCVLNLVRPQDKSELFAEMYRVVRNGGSVAISDIVSDEDVPQELQDDPELWSGCISGAYREDLFLEAFEKAGFHGVELVSRDEQPWRTVQGIEFRSVTVRAFKGKAGPCLERNQAVIYRGPFRVVHDDDGHAYYRGERMAVCDKTYRLLQRPPYDGMFVPVAPRIEVPLDEARTFGCATDQRRHPRVTKGEGYDATTDAGDPCSPSESGSGCC